MPTVVVMLRWPSAIVLPLLLLVACSVEPHERPVPTEVSAWRTDADYVNALESLPIEDKKLLQDWMLRYAFKAGTGEKIPTRTIGEAIEEQRTFRAEYKKTQGASKTGEPAKKKDAPAKKAAPAAH